MSTTNRIPDSVVTGRSPFPAGVYRGNLDSAAERSTKDKEGNETGVFVDVVFKDNQTIDGKTQVGARPYRQSFAIIQKGLSLVDITEYSDETPFMLRRSAGLLAQLALALGAASRDAETNDVVFDMNTFLEDLQHGVYKGRPVLFEVQNRAYKRKDGTPAVDDSAQRFAAPA